MKDVVRPLASLALLLLVPLATATSHEGTLPLLREDRHARALSVLAYHPYPDAQGDPWGLPAAKRNGTDVGYMEAAYGAVQFPTAVFDGVAKVEGSNGFLDTHQRYESLFLDRRGKDPAVILAVGGAREGLVAAVEADVFAKRTIASSNLTLRIVLFEDEVPFDGGNGVDVHRFTVRAVVHDAPLRFLPNGTAQVRTMTKLQAEWNPTKLGVVVSVHNRDPDAADAKPGEVLQAATYLFAQPAFTRQTSKGVLLEYLTATWCPACLYGDGVVEDLANAHGVPNSRLLDRTWTYLREPSLGAVALASLGGAAVLGLAWATRGRTRA